MGTAQSPEQQEGKSECDIQEEHRGQHESSRPQTEDHAGVYATFEDTRANVENEFSEGDVLLAEGNEAMDELAKAQQHQARCQEETKCFCESLDTVVKELNNCRALHGAACRDLEDVGTKTVEFKRKADDADHRNRSHKERCRRARKDQMMAEEVLNNSLGCLGCLVKYTAGATHALTSGVPDSRIE